MKKDWSAIRVTVLLYFIVILLPVNYYFVRQSFNSMRNDATTMNSLVFISNALPSLSTAHDTNEKNTLIKDIDASLTIIEQTFINYPPNKEFVTLFRADEIYALLTQSYNELKVAVKENNLVKTCSNKTFIDVSTFAKTTENMMDYKIEMILDKLYLSLAFTMISIVVLIFFIRLYIKLQLLKHAIHDDITGLYNKKYFNNVLENLELLETRQGKPLSLLAISITNYNELKGSLDKKTFEKYLIDFSIIFSHFFRRSDTVCRIEDDTFASIVPDSTLLNSDKLSKKLKDELQSKLLNSNIKIDVRIGVATYNQGTSVLLLEHVKENMQSSSVITIGGAL